jgi:hypothetical protein
MECRLGATATSTTQAASHRGQGDPPRTDHLELDSLLVKALAGHINVNHCHEHGCGSGNLHCQFLS